MIPPLSFFYFDLHFHFYHLIVAVPGPIKKHTLPCLPGGGDRLVELPEALMEYVGGDVDGEGKN